MDRSITTVCRIVGGGAIAAAWWHREALDRTVQSAWDVMREHWFVQHDTFEPVIAFSFFSIWIHLFFIADALIPFARRWLINPENRKMPSYTEGGWIAFQAGAAYLLPLYFFDNVYPRRRLPLEAPTFFGIIGGLIASHFVYDLLFFPLHVAMHKVKGLRRLHVRHHSRSPLVSIEIIHHGLIDGTLQVMVNIITLNALRLHPLTRCCHNIVITYMLTELHGGYDCPWMLHRLIPFKVLGGPRRHEMHHKSGKHNYQQFFTYLDNMMGAGNDGAFGQANAVSSQKLKQKFT